MNPSPEQRPRHVRYTARWQARLDGETRAKLEELARTFHRKRGAVLRFVLQWGLHHSTGWTIDRSLVVAVPPVPVLLAPELLRQVQDAAVAHGASVATWVRHAVRQVTANDFPESWRAGETVSRSHDSRYNGQHFMLRLDETTARTLQHLVEHFDRPRAEIIRQLIAQAQPEDFPQSWRLSAQERRPPCRPQP